MPLQGKIDVDRGVTIRQIVKFDDKNPVKYTPDPAYGGLSVYMYKDQPGVYYDVHGRVLPEGIAKRAGFPVDKLAKRRHMQEATDNFKQRMAEELALEMGEEVIKAESGDWKVIALPMNRAKVVDKETGESVTGVPMPLDDALALLDELTNVQKASKVIEQQAKSVKQEK